MAVQDFRRALDIQADHFPALADLGIALTALGRHRDAAGLLGAALARDGRPAELHFALGQCQLEGGDVRGAAASFTAAISRNPRFADAYLNLGVVFDRTGDAGNAARCFEQARVLEPKLARAHLNLADVLKRNGRANEAVQVLQQAADVRPDDPDLLCELSESLCDTGRWEEALTAARVAILRAPRDGRAQAAAGMALLGSDQFAPAAEFLERALGFDAGLAYAAVNWGEALVRLQQPERAAQAYRKAHAARPSDAATAVLVASRLEDIGALDAARSVLEETAKRVPREASVHHALGGFLHRRGRLADTLTSYDRALAVAPDHPPTIVDRACALESLGRLAEASAAFEHALALKPDCAQALAGVASCALRRCDWQRGESAWTALEALPNGLDALPPFLLLAAGMDPLKQLRVLERRNPQMPSQVAAVTRSVSDNRSRASELLIYRRIFANTQWPTRSSRSSRITIAAACNRLPFPLPPRTGVMSERGYGPPSRWYSTQRPCQTAKSSSGCASWT